MSLMIRQSTDIHSTDVEWKTSELPAKKNFWVEVQLGFLKVKVLLIRCIKNVEIIFTSAK